MAFKLGDKRVNPLKSRGFMNASPFKSNGNTMAYANGEPEGGPEGKPKEKLVSSTSETTKIGEEKTPEQLAAEKARLQKIADETNESQETIFEYGKGGKAEDVWKTLSDAQKTQFGTVENFRKETDAYNERMSQTVNADPNSKPEKVPNTTPEPNPRQKAAPVDQNIGTKIKENRVIVGYNAERIDGKLIKTPIYEDVEKRVAVKVKPGDKTNADLDQNVQISSTGDKDQVEQTVKDQLEAKTNQSNTVDKE